MMHQRDPLSIGLFLSLLLHALLLLFTISQFFWTPPVDTPSFMAVDIVTLGPQTQAPQLPKPTPTQKAQKNSDPLLKEQSTPLPPKPVVESHEEPDILPQKPTPESPRDDVPLPQQEKPKPKPKKKPEKKETAQKALNKPSLKPKKAPKKKDVGALLSEIEGEDDQNSLDALLSDSESTSTQAASQIGPPTTTELDLIKQQLRKYWNKPDAIKGTQAKVVVELNLTPDGKLQNFVLVPPLSTPQHPAYQIALESVERALNNPAFHLPLPPERYEAWKTLRLTFRDD